MYEHRRQQPVSRRHFVRRLLRHAGYASTLLAFSLAVGMSGYRYLAGLGWVDAFLNAAMLLSGMGPVGELPTTAGKLFAGCFALYSGVVFLIVTGLLLAPVFHRVLHRFHWEADEERAA